MDKEHLKKIQPFLCKAKPKPKQDKKANASLYIGPDGEGVVSSKSESVSDLQNAIKDRDGLRTEEKQQYIAKYNIKDLDVVDKILLVGPSSDIKKYNAEFFKQQKDEGYYILSYSGSIEHFKNINYAPDFWTFSDPTTWNKEFVAWKGYRSGNNDVYSVPRPYLTKENMTSFIENTSLIFLDMYENFKAFGFSSSSAKFLYPDKDHTVYPTWDKLFAHCYSKPVDKSMICTPEKFLYGEGWHLWRDRLMVYQGDKKFAHRNVRYTIDKFSSFLLPTVINYCNNLRDIRVLGFGDFNTGRINNQEESNKMGFYHYLRSFVLMLDIVKLNLKRYKIKLSFLSDESIYKWLCQLNNIDTTPMSKTASKYFTPEYLDSIAKLSKENTFHIGKFHS